MRVLHLACYFNTNALYGQLFRALAQHVDHQTVVSPRGFDRPVPDITTLEAIGRPVWNSVDRLWFGRKSRRYRALIDESDIDLQRVDILHAHTLFTDGFVAHQIHRDYGIPYIVTIRATDINLFARYFFHLRPAARQVLHDAAHVIFINNSYEQRLTDSLGVALPAEKVSVVPNGADAQWLFGASVTPAREKVDMGADIQVVCVAKVVKHKNHRYLVDAIRLLNAENPGRRITLKIVGSFDSKFGRSVRTEYESRDVEFTGPLDIDQIKAVFSQCDVFALPSYSETFGIAYVEAVSQRLPVIYSVGEGFDLWVPDGFWGFACALGNPAQLGARIVELAERGRLPEEALIPMRSLFDWSKIAKRIREQYVSSVKQK